MSKWTETRDAIVDALNVQDVTEQVKQQVTAAILAEVLPTIGNAVDSFTATTREQAKTETGWCKIRDAVVLPYALRAIAYVGKQALAKTMEKTVTA